MLVVKGKSKDQILKASWGLLRGGKPTASQDKLTHQHTHPIHHHTHMPIHTCAHHMHTKSVNPYPYAATFIHSYYTSLKLQQYSR